LALTLVSVIPNGRNLIRDQMMLFQQLKRIARINRIIILFPSLYGFPGFVVRTRIIVRISKLGSYSRRKRRPSSVLAIPPDFDIAKLPELMQRRTYQFAQSEQFNTGTSMRLCSELGFNEAPAH
jgi:hypothetical protein